jgi:hypothetical protein
MTAAAGPRQSRFLLSQTYQFFAIVALPRGFKAFLGFRGWRTGCLAERRFFF